MHKTNNISYAPHKTALHMLVHRSIALHYSRILAQILIFVPHKLGLMEILGFAHSVYPRPILHIYVAHQNWTEEINIHIELLLCFEMLQMPTNSSSWPMYTLTLPTKLRCSSKTVHKTSIYEYIIWPNHRFEFSSIQIQIVCLRQCQPDL